MSQFFIVRSGPGGYEIGPYPTAEAAEAAVSGAGLPGSHVARYGLPQIVEQP